MSEPTFAAPESRSLVLPGLAGIAAVAIGIAAAVHFFPKTTVSIAHLRTETYAKTIEYKNDTIVIGANESNRVFFVASTVRIGNGVRTPLTIDDASLALTDSTGAQLVTKASLKQDLPNQIASFPALKSLIEHPLLRETEIAPGGSAEGTLLFSLRISPEQWKNRASAVVRVDLYHERSVYVTIPKL